MSKPISKGHATNVASKSPGRSGAAPDNAPSWHLETKIPGTRDVNHVRIETYPFRVGRRQAMDLVLSSRSVSSDHAEIYLDERRGHLRVRDLGSTNGTFVNNERIDDARLVKGDILHFADVEFRVGCDEARRATSEWSRHTVPMDSGSALPRNFVQGATKILDMMRSGSFIPVFQPIVLLRDRRIAAYEALTRGCHAGLPTDPTELFRVAADLGLESELSRLFRRKALEALAGRASFPVLFLNSHPEEGVNELLRSVADMRAKAPELDLVLEIHEKALVDPDNVRQLRDGLAEHRVQLAFDDFGVGQSRLVQLAEVPPDYLKFDISFIQNIDKAPVSKRQFLSSIVSAATDLGVMTVAEGIETEAEAAACRSIGFTHGQGYLFGRPLPANEL